MEFDAVLLPPRRAESVARGYWHDRTINDDLDVCCAACPDKLALTAVRQDTAEVRRFTYRQLAALTDRIAVGLSRLGVGRNDVVAMQLPNWWQFSLLYLACSRLGAVLNPLMPIFRERELSFMLKHGEAKVLVVPRQFRNFDHEAMARSLQPQLPSLKRVVVADGGGCRRLRCAVDAAGMGEGAGCAKDTDNAPARPRRYHPTDLHLRHDRRAEGRDALGQYAHGEHHSLCGTSQARKGRYRSDGFADGPSDRFHVRPDDADHAAVKRRAAGYLGSGKGGRTHTPSRA